MSNLPIKSQIYTDTNHDFNGDYRAAGSGKQTSFEGSKDLLVDEEWSTVKKEEFLGEKAEQCIKNSANIEGLPGDDDDLDDEEDDEIDLDEELEIETDEVDVEAIEIDDEDPDDLLEDDDDDDLDDDDDIL